MGFATLASSASRRVWSQLSERGQNDGRTRCVGECESQILRSATSAFRSCGFQTKCNKGRGRTAGGRGALKPRRARPPIGALRFSCRSCSSAPAGARARSAVAAREPRARFDLQAGASSATRRSILRRTAAASHRSGESLRRRHERQAFARRRVHACGQVPQVRVCPRRDIGVERQEAT